MTFLANGLAPIWYINLSTTCEIIRVFTIKIDECDHAGKTDLESPCVA